MTLWKVIWEVKMYCGIDVAKGKSTVCILDKEKNVIAEFDIKHDKQGFETLQQHLTPDMKIGLESTSNYCKALYYFLKEKYNFVYVDTFQMKNFAKLHFPTIKNDKIDAKLIATYLIFNFKTVDTIKTTELQ
jgi:transposase